MQHCTGCGAHDAGANFCGNCGHRFADEPAPEPAAAATTAAPGRRAAPVATRVLKSWAIASGAWLCTGWIVALLIFSSISGSAGGCKGGIDRFSVPTFSSTDNTHWTATYSCYDGGTKTVAYHGQVP